MKRWLGSSSMMIAMMVFGACVVENDAPEGEDESTAEGPSPGEQQAACQASLEAEDGRTCPPGTSYSFELSDEVADWVVVPLDEAMRVDLPHGYFLDVPDDAILAEVFVHNDECFSGCVSGNAPGLDACVGLDAEGNHVCGFTAPTDVASCETFLESCVD